MTGRLTKLVTFKRLRTDIVPDDAGHVDETESTAWDILGNRRGECAETAAAEANSDDQQTASSSWTIVCRGDDLTTTITHRDRIEFHHRGRTVIAYITGIRTVNDVPHWLEFTGVEQR